MSKQVYLVVGTLAYTTLFILAFRAIRSQLLSTPELTIGVVILGMMAVALLALTSGVIISQWLRALLIIGPAVAIALVDLAQVSALIGAGLLLVSLWVGMSTIRWEVVSRITFAVRHLFRGGVRYMTMGVIIGLVALMYPVLAERTATAEWKLAVETIKPALVIAEPALQTLLPGYRTNQTVDEFLTSQFQQQTNTGFTPQQQLTIARRQLETQLGVALTGEQTMGQVMVDLLNQKLITIIRAYPLMVSILGVVALFLTVRVLIPFLVWPILGLIALLIMLLRAMGAIRLEEATAPVQRLTL